MFSQRLDVWRLCVGDPSSCCLLDFISCRLSVCHCQQDSKNTPNGSKALTVEGCVHVQWITLFIGHCDHWRPFTSYRLIWKRLETAIGSCWQRQLPHGYFSKRGTLACVYASVRCGVSGGIFRDDGLWPVSQPPYTRQASCEQWKPHGSLFVHHTEPGSPPHALSHPP